MDCIALFFFCLLLMMLSCVHGLLNKIPSIAIRGGGLRRFNVIRSQATVAPAIIETAKLYGADELLAKTDIFIFDCDGVIW